MARNVKFGPGPGAIRRVKIPVPNPGLAEWLLGPECKSSVRAVTEAVYTIYVNTVPVRRPKDDDPEDWPPPGNLKRGAAWDVGIGGWGKNDRYFGWVYNDALSYRKQKGQPYPRFIEYGKPSKGKPGGYHLQKAAEIVAQNFGNTSNINLPPGYKRDRTGRLHDRMGQFASKKGLDGGLKLPPGYTRITEGKLKGRIRGPRGRLISSKDLI